VVAVVVEQVAVFGVWLLHDEVDLATRVDIQVHG
jgi:hypothetical protein